MSFVLASVLGLTTLALFAISSPVSADGFILRKPLVGSIFTLICILGALAVVFPKECNSILGSGGEGKSFVFHAVPSSNLALKGHHINCERFFPHTLRFEGHVLCAACSGLFIGALASLFGAVLYFFVGIELEQLKLLFVAVGAALVIVGFIQFRFPSFTRLVLNAFFVVGAFLVLIGVDALVENLLIDLYLISLIMLWIFTRILLSQWDHSRTCRSCTSECEMKK